MEAYYGCVNTVDLYNKEIIRFHGMQWTIIFDCDTKFATLVNFMEAIAYMAPIF